MGGAIFLLGYNYGMKTKLLTFLLAPSFLFLFSGSVFGQKTEVKKEYWGEGKFFPLNNETELDDPLELFKI